MNNSTPKFFVEKVFVSSKEDVYFIVALIFSILVNLLFLIGTFVIGYLAILMYVGLAFLFIQGMAVAYIKQNSVKITKTQFANIHDKVTEVAQTLNIYNVPEIYLMQSDGILNAFATRFLFKDYVVLYSDILELAYQEGEDAVNFIIAHELAHVKRKHLSKQLWVFWGLLCPFLGSAYSRACETTCDNIAAYFVPNNSIDGLMVLMAGKKLYKKVNVSEMLKDADRSYGFWAWLSEISSSHPALSKRIYNVLKISETITGVKNEIIAGCAKFVVPLWVKILMWVLFGSYVLLIVGCFALIAIAEAMGAA